MTECLPAGAAPARLEADGQEGEAWLGAARQAGVLPRKPKQLPGAQPELQLDALAGQGSESSVGS